MNNKVRVTIAGRDYTLSTDGQSEYVEQTAEYVNQQINMIDAVLPVSAVDAATMAAMNIADSYFQEHSAAENLRRQLKDALDDAARMKREISDLKMENFRLSQKK